MSRLRPFFSYFGAKWRLAPKYPLPRHGTIIEPFAGSACYSLLYPERDVVLCDRSEFVIDVWRYLIRVSEAEILALPDVPEGGCAADLGLHPEAELLIRWWCNRAQSRPSVKPSTWMQRYPSRHWGQRVRERIASQVRHIRHWRVVCGDYRDLPNTEATWFVDPPYQVAGKYYPGSPPDFAALSDWCVARAGQVIVCENEGATWLPFKPLATIATVGRRGAGRKQSREVVWVRGGADEGGQQALPLQFTC